MLKKKILLFDFDGVIIDSQAIKDAGFVEIFKDFDPVLVSLLIKYHKENGGISRYEKIRYFFRNILGILPTEEEVAIRSSAFSKLMKKNLVEQKFLIKDSIDFISSNQGKFIFHIVSGADQSELHYLCEKLGISQFFVSILGSPATKSNLIAQLLSSYNYIKSDCLMIGDSINDYSAAVENSIDFYGYNNPLLAETGQGYINAFKSYY